MSLLHIAEAYPKVGEGFTLPVSGRGVGQPLRVARALISGRKNQERGPLTLDLCLGGLDVGQHAGHVDAVPVEVLEEDVRVAPGQRTGLCVTQEVRGQRSRGREVVRKVTEAEGGEGV